MSLVDEVRREGAGEEDRSGRYACRGCGSPLGKDYERCPECGGEDVAPIKEVIAPEFTE
jgi:rRNA maturation endonuclease Nob1